MQGYRISLPIREYNSSLKTGLVVFLYVIVGNFYLQNVSHKYGTFLHSIFVSFHS